jgi:hypothetical protein
MAPLPPISKRGTRTATNLTGSLPRRLFKPTQVLFRNALHFSVDFDLLGSTMRAHLHMNTLHTDRLLKNARQETPTA